jgi:hypothetical protein
MLSHSSFARMPVIALGFAAAVAACSGGVIEQGSGGAKATTSTSTSSATNTGGATTTSTSEGGSGGATTTTTTGSSSSSTSASSSSSSSSSSSGTGGAGPNLLDELAAGPWMFGWAGGLDHYSWVRFNFVNATQGSVDVIDSECPSCTGYWPCEGVGLFSAEPGTHSLILQLPEGCNNEGHDIVFEALKAPGGFPMSAVVAADVTDDGNAIEGYRYPKSFCDATFKTCGDPFQ